MDDVAHHVTEIAKRETDIAGLKQITFVFCENTNRYARRCQRLTKLDPVVIPMPDLCEHDVLSIIERLEHFAFIGTLKNKSKSQQVAAFMDPKLARQQLLVAMRSATSGKDFDLILQGEYEELTDAAKLAYVIACIAVSKGAPGVYRTHLMPCIPKSEFNKGIVLDELLKGVLIPANQSGTMLKARHSVIAKVVAEGITPIDLRFDAVVAFLKQVSASIVPNEISRRSPAFLAYRGMVNSEGLFEIFGSDSTYVLAVYEEVMPFYKDDFLFWLQYGMAQIRVGNLDIAENFLNQSIRIREKSHQTLHQMGILYLTQAVTTNTPDVMTEKANAGMDLLGGQIRERGDYDSYPYHAYLTHALRWFIKAGPAIVGQNEWEALRLVGREAKTKYRLDDSIRDAADEVEKQYMKRVAAAEREANE